MQMSEPINEWQVFSIIEKNKIVKIIDMLDETVVKDQFRSTKIKNLEEMGFTHNQARNIIACFINFYLGLLYPDAIKKIISEIDVKEDVKRVIMETFDTVLENGDKVKVAITDKSERLGKFGHKHLYHFEAISEFRPIVANNTLQKLIVSIIIEGYSHDAAHSKATSINFQTDLAGFENLIEELNSQLKRIKTEISILQDKIGDDVVSV